MDDLAVIRRAIEEHHKIRGSFRLAGEAINDMEALFNLQQAHATWGQGSVTKLQETAERLQQSVNAVREGLNNHFGFEEQYLPPIFGKNLMKALVLEHDEIRQKLRECAVSVVADVRGASQEKLLSYRGELQRMVSDLSNTMESHASREEIIFRMLERALESEKQSQAT
jgi:Hemerythrin HHE cation binding domain